MGAEVKKAWGAMGRDELLLLDPEKVTIVEDPTHPLFDERVKMPLDEAFVLNVMAKGVLEPILVRKNGENPDGSPIVEVVAGRQRVRAAREANKRLTAEGGVPLRVPARRVRGEGADLLSIMITENEIRRDDSPMVKARKLRDLQRAGYGDDECAITFGVTKETIRQWGALLDCSADVQKAVERREVPAHVAMQLVKLPREKQKDALDKLKASGPVRGLAGRHRAAEASGREVVRTMTRKEIIALKDRFENSNLALPDAVTVLRYVLGEKKLPKKWTEKQRDCEEDAAE